MKRTAITLEAVADLLNLANAAFAAASGKRTRTEVQQFLSNLDENLASLREAILNGTAEVGRCRRFQIRDPKPRMICAPCFRERVLHHAIMHHVGPVLDDGLIDDTFACRIGYGSLAAVKRCQQHIRRFPWYAKMDIRSYFASIHQATLKDLLARRLKGQDLMSLLSRIIEVHQDSPGCGLPIGALTSQCFANYYLAGLDRFLLESSGVRAYVRYMDDFLVWGDSREAVARAVSQARNFVTTRLQLEIKDNLEINRSARGVTFCGFRVFPGAIRLTQRRKLRFRQCLNEWERKWRAGEIDASELQRGADAAWGIVQQAASAQWLLSLRLNRQAWRDDV